MSIPQGVTFNQPDTWVNISYLYRDPKLERRSVTDL